MLHDQSSGVEVFTLKNNLRLNLHLIVLHYKVINTSYSHF